MKNKWVRIVSFVLVVVVLFAGYYVYSMFSFMNTVSTHKPFSVSDAPAMKLAEWKGTERVNLLVMGVDQRDPNERPRSDTMMLASIDPNTKHLSVFSIMRDTYVFVPGVGQSKINAAFAIGGPELLVNTVQEYLKIPIHYYVAIDFLGFAKVVDAIGGIDVQVKERMVHADDGLHDILLEPGLQHMDGYKALQYVRYRGSARADFDRTERQREVLKLVATELKSPGMLVKFPTILKDVQPHTQTNVSSGDLYPLVSLGLSLGENVQTQQLPPDDMLTETTRNGEMVLVPDTERVRRFVKERMEAGSAAVQPEPSPSAPAGQTPAPQQQAPKPEPAQEQPPAQEPEETGQKGKVTGEYVNIRQKPGTEFPVIGQVYAGNVVYIEGQIDDWYYVRTQDGMLGYIKTGLLQVQ